MKHTNHDEIPGTLEVDPDGIPEALKAGKNMVLWAWEWRSDSWTKVPKQPSGANASATEPRTWCTWEEAWAAYSTRRFSGIGRVLDGNGVCCIDLDDCRVGDDVNQQARELMDRFDSYSEWSPTATGIHIWVVGDWPGRGNKDPARGIEVYADGRYITLSGYRFSHAQGVAARPAYLAELHRDLIGSRKSHRVTQAAPPPEDESEAPDGVEAVITAASAARNGAEFSALMAGDISAYESESEADLALASLITFWTQDRDVILGVLQQSGLWDEKWEREDYQESTIARALDRAEKFSATGSGEHFELSPDPAPIPPGLRESAFPIHALPPVLRRWANAVAESLDTRPEAVATFAWSAISGAIGNSYAVSPKPGWTEAAAVWSCLVAKPGVAKKTPTLKAVNDPMWRAQAVRTQAWKADMRQYKLDLEEWKAAPKDERGDAPEPPVFPHVIVSDVTMEKLAAILNDNPRGLLQERDELRGWVSGMNQYRSKGGGADRQHYLEMWNGGHMKVDRLNRPDPIMVSRAFVAMMGTIQPDMVPTLRDDQGDDGLFYRFLWCWPEGLTPSPWSDRSPDPDVLRDYARLIDNLLALDGYRDDDTGEIHPHVLRLSPEAQEVWMGRYNVHQGRAAADEDRGELYSKTPGHAARLALLVHLIRFQTTAAVTDDRILDADAVNAGWDLAEWYQDQTAKVMVGATQTKENALAFRALKWARLKGMTEIKHTDLISARIVQRSSEAVKVLESIDDLNLGIIERKKWGSRTRVIVRLSPNQVPNVALRVVKN